jgi:serine protease Do
MRLTNCLTLALVAALAAAGSAPAQDIRINPSRDEDRARNLKTNPRVLGAFRPAVTKVAQSTVRVLSDGKPVALGTVVHPDGYILTKASELKPGKLTVKDYDGRVLDAAPVAANDTHDLAMLKVKATDLPAVSWSPSLAAPVGNWVASAGPGDEPVAVGVVSVATRTIPPSRFPAAPPRSPNSPYMGVQFEEDGPHAKLAVVSRGTPADRAGLKAGDVIVSVNGKPIDSQLEMSARILTFKPGDTIRVVIHRGEQILEKSVKLDRWGANGNNFSRGDVQNNMGSKLSERHTGFPTILQHDTVIKPEDCGGPLVDLDGRVLGINIARAGRVESYALPSEVVVPLLADLMAGKSTPTAAGSATPADKVKAAREAVKQAEEEKAAAERKVAAAKAALDRALAEEKAANDAKDEKRN